jgi:predicted nucleic acid-binding protein
MLTPKQKLDFQRTAKIITESQYFKALKEIESSTETFTQAVENGTFDPENPYKDGKLEVYAKKSGGDEAYTAEGSYNGIELTEDERILLDELCPNLAYEAFYSKDL